MQFLALCRIHSGDEQKVVGGRDLLLAVVTAAAGGDSGSTPLHGAGLCQMRGRQSQEAVPPLAEDRQDFREFVVAADVVESSAGQRDGGAEDQSHSRVRRNPGLQQLVAVGRKLKQRRHLRVTRQLGVEHGVAAVGLPDQEVGAAMELAVEESRLEHDVGTRAQGVDGLGMLSRQGWRGPWRQPGRRRTRRVRWPDPTWPNSSTNQSSTRCSWRSPNSGRVLEHLVVFEGSLGGAAQLLVELPEQLVLAAGGRDEVARGEDQVLRCTGYFRFKKKHCAPVDWLRVTGSA